MMPGLAPVVGGAEAPAASLTYIKSSHVTTTSATLNFGNFTTAASGLVIALCMVRGNNARTISSISIGGSGGTIEISNASNVMKAGIATRELAAGTHNVTMTLSGTNGSTNIDLCSVWLLQNYLSATPVSTDLSTTATATTHATTLTIPRRGVAIFGLIGVGNATASWSSATQRYNALSNSRRATSADKSTDSILIDHVETVTLSASIAARQIAASWR